MQPGEGEPLRPGDTEYLQLVGALLHLAVWTRPDISHAVGVLSRFMSAPTQAHLGAAKHVLRYLRGTQGLGITFGGCSHQGSGLQGFADSDWAGDQGTRRSTTGVLFTLYGGPVSWRSKLQPTVALSSVEAEYMALSNAVSEGLWLRQLLADLDVSVGSISIKSDSQGALAMAEAVGVSSRAKHIAIRHHFVREHVRTGLVQLGYVSTGEQPADFLTKGLSKVKFEKCIQRINMCT